MREGLHMLTWPSKYWTLVVAVGTTKMDQHAVAMKDFIAMKLRRGIASSKMHIIQELPKMTWFGIGRIGRTKLGWALNTLGVCQIQWLASWSEETYPKAETHCHRGRMGVLYLETKGHLEMDVSLGYRVSFRPNWATVWDPKQKQSKSGNLLD